MRIRTAPFTLLLALAATGGLVSTARAGVAAVSMGDAPAERAAAVSGVAPVLDAVSDMTVTGGETADQTLHASDADGQALSFYKTAGPSYLTVTTTDPGTGSAEGNAHLAPDTGEAGTVMAEIGVSDGQLTDQRAFQITVMLGEVAPIVSQPANMYMRAGEVQDQSVTATDANGDPLTFTGISAPPFVTVTTTDPGAGVATGNVHVAPGAGDDGTYTVGVRVSDGSLSDQKNLTMYVKPNNPPYLSPIGGVTLLAGAVTDRSLYANDQDSDPLTFSKVAGPSYMTVSTTSQDGAYAYGNMHFAPSLDDAGSTSGTVQVSDGALTASQTFSINVSPPDRPPTLSQPSDMTATVGEIATQSVSATDPDGDYIYLSKTTGPAYVTVQGSGYATVAGTVRLAPGADDVGTATVTITATARGLTDSKSFQVTVSAGNFPPPCPTGTLQPISTVYSYGLIEVQVADFDADGLPDLLMEMPNSGRAAVALGLGNGFFAAATNLDVGPTPVSGVATDLNGDEIPDVAVLDESNGNVYVQLGDGSGAFGPRHPVTAVTGRSMVAADIDRDGKTDLLIADPGTSSVAVLRGNGDGSFGAPTVVPAGTSAWHLATPDLNGDGAPDLVVTNPAAGTISVFRNNGSGAFVSRTDYPVEAYPYAVAAADLDGNGTVDVAVSNGGSSSVTVYRGNGDGTLGAARTFSTQYGPRQIAILDLNGDGHLDLAIANTGSNSVSILLGDGTGAFGPHSDVLVGSGPYGIGSGDFNDDLRPDLAVANYYSGSVTVLLNVCAPERDHPPVVKAPRTVAGSEGALIELAVTASDPDGPELTGLTADLSNLPPGNDAAFAVGPGLGGGTFTWTPSYQAARPTPYTVTFVATNVLSGSATTRITVANTNRPPTADPGGPYTAFAGAPVYLDGTQSGDPDGDALTYSWVYGDGKTGVGASPMHIYADFGLYGVGLTVSDGMATALATTTVSVVGVFEARAFTSTGNRNIRLNAGKPQWCVNLEPVGGAYENAAVNLSSLVMKSDGTGSVSEIYAVSDKATLTGDQDRNGVEEIEACFRREDLRLLFSDVHGSQTVTVTFEANLYAGGLLRAQMDVSVIAGGGPLAASLSPNPLNPEAVLTFATTRMGAVRVEVYDARGRLVRRLMNESALPAGYHDVRINARREDGGPLASGVYFYRIEATEGRQTGRFTILK